MVESNGQGVPGKSTPELVGDLARELTKLVHQEVELATSELAQKGQRAGIGTVLGSGAGMFALIGAGLLAACAVAALHLVMPVWAAALTVGGLVEMFAGVLALAGAIQVRKATPPLPEQAVESTKEDVRWLKSQAQSARR